MKNTLLLALLPLSSVAGIWDPPVFVPTISPSGERTWTLSIALGDIRKEHRTEKRAELVAGIFIAHHKFCDAWEITSEREEKKRLIIEGRCK